MRILHEQTKSLATTTTKLNLTTDYNLIYIFFLTVMGYKLKRITIRQNNVEKQVRPEIPYLCFKANTAGSTLKLRIWEWSPTSATLETSTNGSTWTTYTVWDTITLDNIWDKIYFRNTNENGSAFNSYDNNYRFQMTWSIAASGDIGYLINKNSVTAYTNTHIFYNLFYQCSSLTSCPRLPATTITQLCYNGMFYWCTNLETLPTLPATTLQDGCYGSMFRWCSKIKVSSTQTWDYQTEYRIPITWTWTDASMTTYQMLSSTGGTYTSDPSVNTTYYTSNTVVS